MAKITPFLWFDADAEAAARTYTSIFPRSEITKIVKRPDGVPGPGSVVGLSWQVVPSLLPKLMADANGRKAAAVAAAMMTMVKLDAARLQAAYDAA